MRGKQASAENIIHPICDITGQVVPYHASQASHKHRKSAAVLVVFRARLNPGPNVRPSFRKLLFHRYPPIGPPGSSFQMVRCGSENNR